MWGSRDSRVQESTVVLEETDVFGEEILVQIPNLENISCPQKHSVFGKVFLKKLMFLGIHDLSTTNTDGLIGQKARIPLSEVGTSIK